MIASIGFAFLAGIDRAFAEEMRTFLRDDLGVKAPMVCSQINFSGLPALDREQSMEFADTHVYWQHPNFPGAGWDRANWTIDNSPMVAAHEQCPAALKAVLVMCGSDDRYNDDAASPCGRQASSPD